jgi:hypothetical protein
MTGDAVSDRRDVLRARLVEIRAELIETLTRDGIDGGVLALFGNVGGALDALDRMPVEAEPALRAVVSDDGAGIRLTLHSEDGAAAAATLTPIRAIGFATRLLDAALPGLPR